MRIGVRGGYGQQIRLASEVATLAVALILLGTAALPTVDEPGLIVSSALLVAFTVVWFHVLPRGMFGRNQFLVGALAAQLIAGLMLELTGGIGSLAFPYFLLPVLVTVFDLRWRSTVAVGAVGLAILMAVVLLRGEQVDDAGRDAMLIRGAAFLAVVLLAALAAWTFGMMRRQLQGEERGHRELVAALNDPILVVDRRGRVTDVNRAAEALFGSARGLVGRAASELLPFVPSGGPVAPPRSSGVVSDALGNSVEVEVTRTTLGDAEDARDSVYLVHDISRHAELNRMREQLLYSVAHELRGPLGVLENALDILAGEYAELSSEEFGRVAGSAQRTARRLRMLMEDLLNAGSIQAGRLTIRPRPVALRELIVEAVETIEASLEERGQVLDVTLPDEGLLVMADPRFARQVLSNLMSNASKYSPLSAPISMRVEARGGEACVIVEDRGPGIPAEEQAGLFERFYRMRAGTSEPGVGLGLAIAKGIVEAHGGSIGVESRVGAGTTVWFTLPLADVAAVAG